MESIAAVGLPDVTTTAGRTSWHRAAGRVAARGEHAAVDTACRHYDSGSRIVASRRWAGGSAWRARGSGHGLSLLRQRVVHHGIAPRGRRQHMDSFEAVGTACHRFDSWSYIEALRHRAGGSAWKASRQWILPVTPSTVGRTSIAPPGQAAGRGKYEAVGTACRHHDRTAGRTSRHRAVGLAAARGDRGSGYCLSSLRAYDSRSYIEASRRRACGSAWRASRQWILIDVTTTTGRTFIAPPGQAAVRGEYEAVGTACRHYDSW